jgi:cytoskeletal protein CcmA (bactofilin family)
MSSRHSTQADTAVLGESVTVRGRITGSGSLVVDGRVEGDIALGGDFTLGANAVATSTIDARDVTLVGTLEGSVRARGDVRIAAGATVRGDVVSGGFVLEEGAAFVGRLDADFTLPAELGNSSAPLGSAARNPRRA